jgi:AraC family transcriptional regulator
LEWSKRMNAAVDYIEENLAGELDFNEAANRAFSSTYHFQRVFLAVNGITPAEYTRRRRLTLAARDLTSTSEKVIDIATKYGYESPNAFTRAFRNLHGVTPKKARELGVTLTAFPRIIFQIIAQGGNDMNYKIIRKPAFEVVGQLKKVGSTIGKDYLIDPEVWDKNWQAIWEEFEKSKHDKTLEKLTQGKPGPFTGASFLGVCVVDREMARYIFTVGVEKPDTKVPVGFEVIRIPAATWAVFEATGPFPYALHDVEDQIFKEWLPSTGYELDDKPELDIYLPGDRESKKYRCQSWMPVVTKR